MIGGGFGGRLSLTALTESPHFELTAVADLRPELHDELTTLFPGIKTFTDHETLLRECPPDVVCVSTYAPTHVAIAEAALSLPLKGLLVEKPLSDSVAAARQLFDRIRQRGLPLAVPHGLVTLSAGQEIIRMIRAGELGQLRLIEMQSPGWDIINAGIHWFHFALQIAGLAPVRSVLTGCDGSAQIKRDGMQVETSAVTYVTLENGVRLILQTGEHLTSNGRGDPGAAHFRIVGTGGLIEYHAWSDRFWLVNATHPAGTEITREDDDRSQHQRHLESLLPAMADQCAPQYQNAEASLISLEICMAAYQSANHRVEAQLPFRESAKPPDYQWTIGIPS